jgi:4-carboxymuconolactone decarboxylase
LENEMPRIGPIDPNKLSDQQQKVYDQIAGGARGGVTGPFTMLLHVPELASRVEQLGVALRFESDIPSRLRELAVCTVAAHWKADYEWYAHARLAKAQGISDEVLQSIGTMSEAQFAQDDERIVYIYARQLLAKGSVEEDAFQSASKLLGQRGVIELTALLGYYSLLAFTLNSFEVAVPAGAVAPWHS